MQVGRDADWRDEAPPPYLERDAGQHGAADARTERCACRLTASWSPTAGSPAHWGGLLYDTKRAGRGFIADRGFASIGYGLPGGDGRAAGRTRSRRVVGITGDGGFNMMLGELETARRSDAPIVFRCQQRRLAAT